MQSSDFDILKLKDEQIAELVNKLDYKNKELEMKNKQIVELINELNNLRFSVTFRLTRSVVLGIDNILPNGTVRGEFKKIIINSIRTLLDDGLVSFLRHIMIKMKRREFKILDKLHTYRSNNIDINTIIENINNFTYKPKISILMPVYNSESLWLKMAINSVINQLYDNWELCICDDNSSKFEIKDILKEYSNIDNRIKVIFSNTNEGISKATNNALSLATGEYIVLLDHDDEFTIDALYEIVAALNINKDYDFIYSDEDKISVDGKYIEPFLKPDFSIELLRCMNYLIHLAAIRTEIIKSIGGFNDRFDGAQDYELFFRIIEKTKNVYHIRKVLYHWRMSPLSGAQNALAKPWIYQKGMLAIQMHLKRLGIDANVKFGYGPGLYDTNYIIKDNPDIDIIIPTRKLSLFKKCITSLKSITAYQNYNLWAVINDESDYKIVKINSKHGEELEQFLDKDTGLIGPKLPYNWSRMNNLALSNTYASYIVFMNDDIEMMTTDWINYMLQYAQFDHIGAVGIMLLYKDYNAIQHAGDFIGEYGTGEHCFNGMLSGSFEINGLAQVVRECSAVTSACMMIRRETYKKIGGFDENLRNYDDFDFCLRLRKAGYTIIYTPYVRAYHDESPIRPQIDDKKTINYLLKKHKPEKYDSFYRYEWENMYKTVKNHWRK